MRHSAVAIATALVLSMISPAFAQPFADTPTNHWAYDAIAELAAKGLIEGYPDGTFKGDRAMTRYEMAMVVARLLARIESIQIPAPTPQIRPEVGRSDVDTILRLVNEFRAELAAKNVRLTAVEEELNALKAKLDNVRITGGFRFREDLNQWAANIGSPGTTANLNGNPRSSSVGANVIARGNRPRYEFKIQFDGSVSQEMHLITALESATGFQFFNSSSYGFSNTQPGTFANSDKGACCSIDSFFLDYKPGWGPGWEFRLGRFGNDTPCGGGTCYPVQFGPFGLLLNNNANTWEDSTFNSGQNVADGLWLLYNNKELSDLMFQAVWIRITGSTGSSFAGYPTGEDAYGFDANIALMPSLRAGLNYVANNIGNTAQPGGINQFYHLYGPGAGASLNPATARCPAVAASGIQCPALGSGWGGYVNWDAWPGIHVDVEAAQWQDGTAGGSSDNAYILAATWNLSTLLNVCCNLNVTTQYEYAGVNFYTPYGSSDLDGFCDCWDDIYPGNAQGFTVMGSIQPWQGWTIYLHWLTGNNVSNSQSITEYAGGVSYAFSPGAKITFKYRDLSMNGVEQMNVYRAQIDYGF